MDRTHDRELTSPMQAQHPQVNDISELIGEMRNLADLVSTVITVLLAKDRKPPEESKEMQAIALLLQDGPRIRSIAKRLGVSHTALYGWERFMRYYKPMADAERSGKTPRVPRRGFHTDSGLEAVD